MLLEGFMALWNDRLGDIDAAKRGCAQWCWKSPRFQDTLSKSPRIGLGLIHGIDRTGVGMPDGLRFVGRATARFCRLL